MQPHEQIFEILFDKDEVTWQTILYELVKSEQMDPWDINVTLLSQKYIDMIQKLKELNFRISGKIILAAAIILKIKSDRLLGKDLNAFDSLFAEPQDDMLYEDLEPQKLTDQQKLNLIPRVPQPRKRKVSIYDLVNALEQALEVKRRRVLDSIPEYTIELPTKKRDVSEIIKVLYFKIRDFFIIHKDRRLTFSTLIPSQSKEDKVYTFIPLLHLTNQRKIDLDQKEHFGEIEILLRTEQEIVKELQPAAPAN
jgi:segregation and condensation protein A